MLLFVQILVILKLIQLIYSIIKCNLRDSKKEFAINKLKAEIRNLKRCSNPDCPPYYQSGWICVQHSSQLPINRVKVFIALGRKMIGFRNSFGYIIVIDVLCSHSSQTTINVFSGEAFDYIRCLDNDCSYQIKIHSNGELEVDQNLNIKSYPVFEQDNIIYIWNHPHKINHSWKPTKLDDKYELLTTHAMYINAIVQDVFENSADESHFHALHRPLIVLENVSYKYWLAKYLYYEFEYDWEIMKNNLILNNPLKTKVMIFGKKLLEVQVISLLEGHTSISTYISLFGMECLIRVLVVPLHLNKSKLQVTAYSDSSLKNKIFAFITYKVDKIIFDPDLPIWANKMFVKNVLYTRKDRHIPEFRKWSLDFC